MLMIAMLLFAAAGFPAIEVVATLPNYAWLASAIGGPQVHVQSIVLPDQDPHFVRPKPSFALMMQKADLFISTGLDLELWSPALLDKAGNSKILEGRRGYCAIKDGVPLREVPATLTRAYGDLHIYGNPHFYQSPVHLKLGAHNVVEALLRVDPAHGGAYQKRYEELMDRWARKLYGDELVAQVRVDDLDRWAADGTLLQELEHRKLTDSLGGWLKKAMPLRGRKAINYHTNWTYFSAVFGIESVGMIEPKPGIPPSPRNVQKLIETVKTQRVDFIFDAPYYEEEKMKRISEAIDVPYVILPVFVGDEGAQDFFSLMDLTLDRLLALTEAKP
jgi:ABC-type Zn uptake system ZnuABC Zn-binding protein ZnuA